MKLEDSNGNDYSKYLTVYPSVIGGLNCVNVTLVMDADTFCALSGTKLTISAVCTKDGQDNENGYAGCEMEISIPENRGETD